MKIKTAELTGAALDWAVAKCVGSDPEITQYGGTTALRFEHRLYSPSTDWATGGPIIERERIDIWCYESDLAIFRANIQGSGMLDQQGRTMLIAAMRCYVASKLGDEIEVPKELLK